MTRVLFLGKAEDWHSKRASTFCESNFVHTVTCLGLHGDPFPEAAADWEGDAIVSYLSGNSMIRSWMKAALAASSISSWVASGLP